MPNPNAGTAPTPHILVVEDDTIIAMDIAMQLRDLGYDPLGPARTGEQAIEMVIRLRPLLVLMDIHLGSQMDGITAAQEIRTQSGIPCVFLSAFTDEETQARAKRTNPAGYLAKPFTEYELRTVIRAFLPPPSEDERELIDSLGVSTNEDRLGCQIRVTPDLSGCTLHVGQPA